MPDPWEAGPPYERFMGRWSRLIAISFIKWLSPPPALHWLDLGCGTGSLSEAILANASPASVVAIDPSEKFIAFAERRLTDSRINFWVGDALHLPVGPHTSDIAVSGLVLNFIAEPATALRAVSRTLRPGGTIGAYVWDYAGKMEMLRYFWDSVVALDPRARDMDEGVRFHICQPDELAKVFTDAGLQHIEVTGLEIEMAFTDFSEYWMPFLGGQGPAPGYIAGLDTDRRAALEKRLLAALPISQDGSLRLAARAWAIKATS